MKTLNPKPYTHLYRQAEKGVQQKTLNPADDPDLKDLASFQKRLELLLEARVSGCFGLSGLGFFMIFQGLGFQGLG